MAKACAGGSSEPRGANPAAPFVPLLPRDSVSLRHGMDAHAVHQGLLRTCPFIKFRKRMQGDELRHAPCWTGPLAILGSMRVALRPSASYSGSTFVYG